MRKIELIFDEHPPLSPFIKGDFYSYIFTKVEGSLCI